MHRSIYSNNENNLYCLLVLILHIMHPTGIGINNDYYDLGPEGNEIIPGVHENIKPWWRKDENDQSFTPENLNYILSELENSFSSYPTVVATFCACNETANKARKYWNKKIWKHEKQIQMYIFHLRAKLFHFRMGILRYIIRYIWFFTGVSS